MSRILILNHAAQLGGAEMILIDLASHLGPRCTVVLLADGPLRASLERRGVAVEILAAGRGMMGVTREAGGLRTIASVPAVAMTVLRFAARARAASLLYANSQKAAVVAMLVALLLRKKCVWHMHDILSGEHFAGLQRRFSVRLARAARARVIVISEAARRAFLAAGGDPARVTVVSNGIDPALFAAEASPPQTLRARLGIGDARLIGVFGRLTPWKGQHVLVDAMALMPGIHALIVGDALFGEDAYRQSLVDRAKRAGVADRVHFLGHRDDVPALMRDVDLVLHCSTSPEPFGRVIVEAMLARRPVVASAHGASAELLGATYPGLAAPGDARALAHVVLKLLDLPAEERAALIEANDRRARARFTLDRMMRDIDAVIERAEAA